MVRTKNPALLKKRGYRISIHLYLLIKITMKYSYSPKYPLEISGKIYINKIIGQVFSENPVKWSG
jgi:hypothetical protein